MPRQPDWAEPRSADDEPTVGTTVWDSRRAAIPLGACGTDEKTLLTNLHHSSIRHDF